MNYSIQLTVQKMPLKKFNEIYPKGYSTDTERVTIIRNCLPMVYGVTYDQINVRSRKRELCEPRQHYMAMLRKYTKLGYKNIAKEFKLDHSTAIHAIHTILNLLDSDKRLKQTHSKFIAEIESRL